MVKNIWVQLCIILSVIVMFSCEQSDPAPTVGKIKFTISDQATGIPLKACNVLITTSTLGNSKDENLKYSGETDTQGNFTQSSITPGTYYYHLTYAPTTTDSSVIIGSSIDNELLIKAGDDLSLPVKLQVFRIHL